MFGFEVREAGWPVVAFVVLALLGRARRPAADQEVRPTWVTSTCMGLALFFVGIFVEAWHRPGAPPEIDAGPRETMILEGCVVEPTVFSEGREQFTLELAEGARARVTLGLREGDVAQELAYGQRVE